MKRIMQCLAAVAVSVPLCVSCADGGVAEVECAGCRPDIAFSASTFEVVADASGTRAGHGGCMATMELEGTEDVGDSLCLQVSSEDFPPCLPELRTRGKTVGGGITFGEAYPDGFRVSAYTPDGRLYIDNASVGRYSGTAWSFDGDTHYWLPDTQLDFYARAPQAYAGKELMVGDNAPAFNGGGPGTLRFSWTVPRSSDELQDALAQPDLLFAYKRCSLAETAGGNGTVPLTFSHALAGVRFVARDIAGGTVESISIEGVYGQGECEVSLAGGAPVYDWTPGGESLDYVQTFGLAVEDRQGGDQVLDVTDSVFMMIPQTLPDGAAIRVVMSTSDGRTHELVASLGGQIWEAGRLYTYAISTTSINWTYVFEVTPHVTLPDGNVSSKYGVKSYRYRTYGDQDATAEPVSWSASPSQPSSAADLEKFVYGGAGSVGVQEYALKCRPLDLLASTWSGDMEVLRKNTPLGTKSSPYDLSTQGGTAGANTANCYLVHAAGHYRIPLVYGNALKGGSPNAQAYSFAGESGKNEWSYLNAFKRVGGDITQPYIYGDSDVADCCLLWQDAINVVRDVRLSGDGKYLEFEVDATNLVQGNAIVAVRDAGGNILWSWHIWVTEYDPGTPLNPNDGTAMVAEIEDYDNASVKYGMLTKQIGWCDSKTLTYMSRTTEVSFVQEGSGKTGVLQIGQQEYKFMSAVNNGVYFQWGRKDPSPGITTHGTVSVKRCYDAQDEPVEELNISLSQTTLEGATSHPEVLYLGSPNWQSYSKPYNNLWNNRPLKSTASPVKTVYDPSPAGFMVADRQVFRVFSTTGASQQLAAGQGGTLATFLSYFNGEYDNGGDSKYVYTAYTGKGKGGSAISFPATGERCYKVIGDLSPGQLLNPSYVYSWIADVAGSQGSAWTLALGYGSTGECAVWVGYGSNPQVGACAMARPVYCVRER